MYAIRSYYAAKDGVAVGADRDVLAVARGVGIRRRDAGHDVTGALAHEAEDVGFRDQRFHHREHRFIERDIDHLPRPAVDLAMA